MSETVKPAAIRSRLRDLNTKAYYLLVALSFLYYQGRATANGTSVFLKLALTFTGIVAVLPVQDYIKSEHILESIRNAKVILLIVALLSTMIWLWCFS